MGDQSPTVGTETYCIRVKPCIGAEPFIVLKLCMRDRVLYQGLEVSITGEPCNEDVALYEGKTRYQETAMQSCNHLCIPGR